jgi:hypothetical protein
MTVATIDDVLAILAAHHDRLEEMLAKLGWPLPGQLGSKWLDEVSELFQRTGKR